MENTLKLALFRSLRSGTVTAGGEIFERVDGYIRVSVYVDVSFPMLGRGLDIHQECRELTRLEKLAEAECEKKLEIIRGIRERLENAAHAREISPDSLATED